MTALKQAIFPQLILLHCSSIGSYFVSLLKVGKYFMPCLLRSNHAFAKEVQVLASFNPAPILFVPQSKSCYDSPSPLGVFSALVVDMSTKSGWDRTKCDVCFRNQMQFDVKHKDSRKTYTVELRHHATYIELRLICDDKILRPHILATFQQQLLCSLEGLSEKHTHMNAITWELGFFCPSSIVEGSHPHPALVELDMSTEDMTCTFISLVVMIVFLILKKSTDLCWFEVRNEYRYTCKHLAHTSYPVHGLILFLN